MTVWRQPPDVAAMNASHAATLVSHLGIEITAAGIDFIEATMPVTQAHRQPMGLMHGGASLVLAETLGSLAAYQCVERERFHCVGIDISATHVRSVKDGIVTGRVKPVHVGKRLQVWEITVRDQKDRTVCIARLTTMVVANGA